RLQEAGGMLDQAQAGLEKGGFLSAELRARLAEEESALTLTERLDALRLEMSEIRPDGKTFAYESADRGYVEAFAAPGLGGAGDGAAEVARRIGDSPARAALVAALDSWAVAAGGSKRAWVLAVARAADPDPVRDQLRDPALWANEDRLAEAVRAVDGASLPPN